MFPGIGQKRKISQERSTCSGKRLRLNLEAGNHSEMNEASLRLTSTSANHLNLSNSFMNQSNLGPAIDASVSSSTIASECSVESSNISTNPNANHSKFNAFNPNNPNTNNPHRHVEQESTPVFANCCTKCHGYWSSISEDAFRLNQCPKCIVEGEHEIVKYKKEAADLYALNEKLKFDNVEIQRVLMEYKHKNIRSIPFHVYESLGELNANAVESCSRANLESLLSRLRTATKLIEEKLEDFTLCIVCQEKERSVVCLPCGHLICCQDCISEQNQCPICRTILEGKQVVYNS